MLLNTKIPPRVKAHRCCNMQHVTGFHIVLFYSQKFPNEKAFIHNNNLCAAAEQRRPLLVLCSAPSVPQPVFTILVESTY